MISIRFVNTKKLERSIQEKNEQITALINEVRDLKATVGVWRKAARQADDLNLVANWIQETPEEWEQERIFNNNY